MATKRKGCSQKTTVLPIAEKLFAKAKKHPEYAEQYCYGAFKMGECDSIQEVQIKFEKCDNVYIFLRSVGIIGDNK